MSPAKSSWQGAACVALLGLLQPVAAAPGEAAYHVVRVGEVLHRVSQAGEVCSEVTAPVAPPEATVQWGPAAPGGVAVPLAAVAGAREGLWAVSIAGQLFYWRAGVWSRIAAPGKGVPRLGTGPSPWVLLGRRAYAPHLALRDGVGYWRWASVAELPHARASVWAAELPSRQAWAFDEEGVYKLVGRRFVRYPVQGWPRGGEARRFEFADDAPVIVMDTQRWVLPARTPQRVTPMQGTPLPAARPGQANGQAADQAGPVRWPGAGAQRSLAPACGEVASVGARGVGPARLPYVSVASPTVEAMLGLPWVWQLRALTRFILPR